ncbi:hypothetical protein [Streptomyces sp. CB03238]|uniref:hypothetical protein n=1 Tax=Streptomyces sp. CB03238 TaxID=1907777 RepID=UPI001F4E1A50|nr:hypothetical protein [Streptomyces sp. CB03238]
MAGRTVVNEQSLMPACGRGTPSVHDVDIVAIHDPDEHPEWGNGGPSAEEALEHMRGQVSRLLSQSSGT